MIYASRFLKNQLKQNAELVAKKRCKLSSIELTDGHVIQTERSIYKITLSFPIQLRKAPSIPQANETTHRTPNSKSSSNVKNPNETNESNNPPGKQVEEADVAYHPPTRYGQLDYLAQDNRLN